MARLNGLSWRRAESSGACRRGMSARAPCRTAREGALFHGRGEVSALHREVPRAARSGYARACANERRAGVCRKPQVVRSPRDHRSFCCSQMPPFTRTRPDDARPASTGSSQARAVAFWRLVPIRRNGVRMRAFVSACKVLDAPAALDISCSGASAHARIFFERMVPSREARPLMARQARSAKAGRS